jgi:prepilin-type N-terminal cleavage/methylation domain-containing protein
MPATRRNAERRQSSRGFTLIELFIVVVIIGIMAAMSVPSFQRAIEQSKLDIAAANLRTIWTAERLYWLENQSYTTDLTALQSLKLIDPTISGGTASGGYTYGATVASGSLTATATRTGGVSWTGSLTISGEGEISGGLTMVGTDGSGPNALTPGYQ